MNAYLMSDGTGYYRIIAEDEAAALAQFRELDGAEPKSVRSMGEIIALHWLSERSDMGARRFDRE